MAKIYSVMNGDVPGAAAAVAISTGTAIRTHLQLATSSTTSAIRVTEWWATFDGTTANAPGKVELIRHAGGAQTTLTAYSAAMITKVNDPNASASSIQLGTALSGFSNTTTEVAPTTVTNFSTQFVPPTSGIYIQYPLGREPEVAISQFARIRITTASGAVTCLCGVSYEE